MPFEESKKILEDKMTVIINKSAIRAKTNYIFSYLFLVLTIIASAVAACGGILLEWTPKIVGVVALIPGILATASSTLKLNEKANFHYNREKKVAALRRYLQIVVPDLPDRDAKLSEVTTGFSTGEIDLEKLWPQVTITPPQELDTHINLDFRL